MKTLKEIVADFLKDVHSPCSEEDLLEALQRTEPDATHEEIIQAVKEGLNEWLAAHGAGTGKTDTLARI